MIQINMQKRPLWEMLRNFDAVRRREDFDRALERMRVERLAAPSQVAWLHAQAHRPGWLQQAEIAHSARPPGL
jgi:hypothetical protein